MELKDRVVTTWSEHESSFAKIVFDKHAPLAPIGLKGATIFPSGSA